MTRQEKASEDMLMAYADGELDPASAASVAAAVAADPALAAQVEEFRVTRRLAARAFADVVEESVPARLVAAALRWPPRRRIVAGFALAASIAVVVGGAAGYQIGGWATQDRPALLAADPDVTHALDGEASGGETRGAVKILATYTGAGAVCRVFATTDVRGIGCRRGETWRVELALVHRARGAEDAYVTASDGTTQTIDAFLDAIGAQDPLDADAERALRAAGWRISP